jgi:U3 small nucleolar RNA-associated protein 23
MWEGYACCVKIDTVAYAHNALRPSVASRNGQFLRSTALIHSIPTPPSLSPTLQILIDGNFIYMALKVKMDIKDRLKKMLLGESFVCYVPQAVLDELAALGPAFQPALEWARTCCEVLSNPPPVGNDDDRDNDDDDKAQDTMSAGEAIRALVGEENKGKYMVATQDQELKSQLRHVPSVGLLFVSRAVLLMEPPSNTSKAVSAKQEGEKFRLLSEEERLLLATIRKKDKAAASGEKAAGSAEQQQQQQQQQQAAMGRKIRTKKKPKGPNPLSVKKSGDKKEKKKTTTTPVKKGGGEKKMEKSGGGGGGGAAAGGGGGGGEGGGNGKKRKRQKRKGASATAGGGGS